MLRFLAVGLFISQLVILVRCNGFYSIVAPGTLRSKSDYHVTVSIHQAPSPCQIKIRLIGPEFEKSEIVEIPPKSSKTVMFQLPKLKDGNYNLTAEGLSGIEFENTTNLYFAAEQFLVYIQTDKLAYNPGDIVQYYVLVLDKNTRPAKVDGPVKIAIEDPARNLIKQLNNTKLIKGVFYEEIQLSELAEIGSWNIEVSADGTTETKKFDVEKYVLPKFDIVVEAPIDVAVSDGTFSVTIRSKYTYGKPLKGKAVVTFPFISDKDSAQIVEKTIPIDGESSVDFDISKGFELEKGSWALQYNILAIVEEELTGLKQNSTRKIYLHGETYRIENVKTPNQYYPDEPFTIKLVVKYLDGSPVQDTKNPVTLSVSPSGESGKNYTATIDKDGMVKFEVLIAVEDSLKIYSVRAYYLDSTSYLTSLYKTEKIDTPKADESLQIIVQTENPTLGKNVSIKIENGRPIPYIVYTIIGRGDIVQSGIIEVPENRNYHAFNITSTFAMIPRAEIFIHYIVGTYFFYAEKTINFEKDFENSISIEAPVEVKPGSDVAIKVKTDPNSYIALLGTDQSLYLLKSDYDLSKDRVFNDLSRYDSKTPSNIYPYTGQKAGIVIMTNGNILDPYEIRRNGYPTEKPKIEKIDEVTTVTPVRERKSMPRHQPLSNKKSPEYDIQSTSKVVKQERTKSYLELQLMLLMDSFF